MVDVISNVCFHVQKERESRGRGKGGRGKGERGKGKGGGKGKGERGKGEMADYSHRGRSCLLSTAQPTSCWPPIMKQSLEYTIPKRTHQNRLRRLFLFPFHDRQPSIMIIRYYSELDAVYCNFIKTLTCYFLFLFFFSLHVLAAIDP